MRYFIHLAYNGKNYFGWQRQPNAISVQSTLENAFSLLLKTPISIVGAGRTDTGVHAKNFYAHFDTSIHIKKNECEQLAYRLNAFLPADIVIFSIFEVSPEAHARFDAQIRTYNYYITTTKNPFNIENTYHFYRPLNIEKMNEACKKLFKYNDFTSFSKVHTQNKTNLCTIKQAQWYFSKEGLLVFEISANRFLRNMVRAIVGTLLEVGQEKCSIEDFCKIIEEKNRCKAGISVPAHALYLSDIVYPKSIFQTTASK